VEGALIVSTAAVDTGVETTVDVDQEVDHRPDSGDHDRFAHYVIGGTEAIMRSAVTGEPVVALCGKVWVPNRSPEAFTLCPTCKDIQDGRDPNLIDP